MDAKELLKIKRNSEIKEKLSKLISVAKAGKSARSPKPAPTVKVEFLTPEKAEKLAQDDGFGAFDVVDYTGRFVLIPAGYPLSQDVISLVVQLAQLNPKALFIKQAQPDSKKLAEKDYFPKEYWGDEEYKPNEIPDTEYKEMMKFLE